MASLLFAITANAQNITNNAQNKCTVNYGTNNYFTVKSSRNIVLEQKGDNVITGRAILPKITPNRHETATHTLTICPEGSWSRIEIRSNNGYYNRAEYNYSPDGLHDEVEECEYEVLVFGQENQQDFYWSTYNLSVFEDITFSPTASTDATNRIYLIGVDENGVSLSEKEINLMYYDVAFNWLGNVEFIWNLCGEQYSNQINNCRFNNLTGFDRISVYAWIATQGQRFYFIEYPAIIGADNNNWALENNAEDLKLHDEWFSLSNESERYYYVDYLQFIRNDIYIDGGIGITGASGFDDHVSFNPDRPISVLTNINAGNPDEFENGQIKIKLAPCAFVKPLEEIAEKVVASNMWYDIENNVIREPIDVFDDLWFLTLGNTPNYFERTPVSGFYFDKKDFYYAERTPIAYFQSYNYNEYASPFGYAFCEGMFLFMGERGCQRIGDQTQMIKVFMDGEEVFYDNLYNFNQILGHFDPEEPCEVRMEINNEYLFCDGVEKSNQTKVIYDLHNDDATPPTLTILQIMDEDNNEEVFLPEYKDGHINFAAGDFEAHVHELWGIDHMQYFAKPNVEVYYSIENEEWISLEYIEDETMFHPNYGNFFTIDLSQMDAAIADKWVSLKFIVTDEAGNIQMQELSNVFYAGENVSVNEHIAEGSEHTVYPNPFTNEVKITAAQAVEGEANIAVYNVLGEQVYSKTYNCDETKEFIIDGSTWKPGVYFYSISTKDGLLQGKIVKE